MINATDDLIWDLQDQAQRIERKVDWLVSQAGGNPSVIGAVPRELPSEAVKAA